RLPRRTRTGHGKDLASLHLDADIVGQNLAYDGARQMICLEGRTPRFRSFGTAWSVHRILFGRCFGHVALVARAHQGLTMGLLIAAPERLPQKLVIRAF